MLELLKKLVEPVSPSGCEKAVGEVISELAAPWGEVRRDAMGNILVRRPGTGRRIMASAHMDSTGVIVTYVDKNGYARFSQLGGLQAVNIQSQRMRFSDGTLGIVYADAGTYPKDLTLEKQYLDTAGKPVRPGDVAVYDSRPVQQGELVVSPYLDDRIGCAILLKAMRLCENSENDLWFVFTVQEEVGVRGAGPAAFAIEPELGIAVDVTGNNDVPGSKRPDSLKLGGGPVMKLMDTRSISDRDACALVEETARELGLSLQIEVATRGGTDASAIQASRSGTPITQLAIATRYIHSPNEMASLQDAEQCAQLLAAVMCRQAAQ